MFYKIPGTKSLRHTRNSFCGTGGVERGKRGERRNFFSSGKFYRYCLYSILISWYKVDSVVFVDSSIFDLNVLCLNV